MSYYWGWGNKVQYTVIGADARVRRVVDIEVTGSPMMHDFSLTENHVIIYDLPCVFDLDAVAGLVPRACPGASAAWWPGRRTVRGEAADARAGGQGR